MLTRVRCPFHLQIGRLRPYVLYLSIYCLAILRYYAGLMLSGSRSSNLIDFLSTRYDLLDSHLKLAIEYQHFEVIKYLVQSHNFDLNEGRFLLVASKVTNSLDILKFVYGRDFVPRRDFRRRDFVPRTDFERRDFVPIRDFTRRDFVPEGI